MLDLFTPICEGLLKTPLSPLHCYFSSANPDAGSRSFMELGFCEVEKVSLLFLCVPEPIAFSVAVPET